MTWLQSNEKSKLTHLAKAGDLLAQGYMDHEADLLAIHSGKVGKIIVARLASTANIASLSGLSAIDSVTPVAGNIVLVKNQDTQADNGLYVASASAWTRMKDINNDDVITVGMRVIVSEGTVAADTDWVLTNNSPIVVGTDALVFAQLTASGVSSVDLAATTSGKGASLVGIQDAASLITATTVEAALLELVKYVPVALADPGTGVAIPVTRSASVAIVTAAAETNTLAIPSFKGQRLFLYVDTYAVGDRVVTCAQAINQAGNTIMTFGASRDSIMLEAITVGSALRWQVTANDGVALS